MLRQQNFFVYVHLSIDSFRIKNNTLLSKYLFSLLEMLPAPQGKPSYKVCSASVVGENTQQRQCCDEIPTKGKPHVSSSIFILCQVVLIVPLPFYVQTCLP
jgi:hypothetical protein